MGLHFISTYEFCLIIHQDSLTYIYSQNWVPCHTLDTSLPGLFPPLVLFQELSPGTYSNSLGSCGEGP